MLVRARWTRWQRISVKRTLTQRSRAPILLDIPKCLRRRSFQRMCWRRGWVCWIWSCLNSNHRQGAHSDGLIRLFFSFGYIGGWNWKVFLSLAFNFLFRFLFVLCFASACCVNVIALPLPLMDITGIHLLSFFLMSFSLNQGIRLSLILNFSYPSVDLPHFNSCRYTKILIRDHFHQLDSQQRLPFGSSSKAYCYLY